jgi:hypothetical protein
MKTRFDENPLQWKPTPPIYEENEMAHKADYNILERLATFKHSSLLGPFISFGEIFWDIASDYIRL